MKFGAGHQGNVRYVAYDGLGNASHSQTNQSHTVAVAVFESVQVTVTVILVNALPLNALKS